MTSFFSSSNDVVALSPDHFDPMDLSVLKDKSCTAILFFAPWCPHCVAVKPVWEQLGKKVKFMTIAAFDCEKYKNHIIGIRQDNPSLVTSYPTMIFYKNGKPVRKFGQTDRTFVGLLNECQLMCKN